MSNKTLAIHDVIATIPRNPHYRSIPKRTKRISHVVWHCDDALDWNHQKLIAYDLGPNHISDKGCPCPTYAYYIERDGSVWQLAKEESKTWHVGVPEEWADVCPQWNEICLGICIAHKPSKEARPNAKQIASALLLTAEIISRLSIQSANVKGHRELAGTGYDPNNPSKLRKTCPGLGIDMDEVRNNLHRMKSDVVAGRLVIERVKV